MKRWALTRRDRWYPHQKPVGYPFRYIAFTSGGDYVWVRLFDNDRSFDWARNRFEKYGIPIIQTGRVRFKTRYVPEHGVVRPI